LWPIEHYAAEREERGFAELVGINFGARLEINPFVFLSEPAAGGSLAVIPHHSHGSDGTNRPAELSA
jgi:hypothetical protein